MTTDDQYVPDEEQVRAWCREGVGDYPDVMDEWITRFLARVRRDAAQEALGSLQSFARDCMDGEHGEIDHETFAGWHHTWAAAMQHRATHYPHPEETEHDD